MPPKAIIFGFLGTQVTAIFQYFFKRYQLRGAILAFPQYKVVGQVFLSGKLLEGKFFCQASYWQAIGRYKRALIRPN
jgi:hypothetical protein